MKLKLKNFNTRKLLVFVAVIALIFYVVNGLREKYTEESVGPSMGPSVEPDVEKDEKVEKIVKELDISQEDLDLMFEMMNANT